MTAEVIPLYPEPGPARPLKGLYLDERLHEQGSAQSPLVYANFVSSLDGRIALIEADGAESNVLEDLTSSNDFRLFQELQAQADCLVTHGAYLRALAKGGLGNVLQIDNAELIAWRKRNSLPEQPTVVVASGSLDFPMPDSIEAHGQPLYIATGEAADPVRVQTLRSQGFKLIFAGSGKMIEGAPLVSALGGLGYKCLYFLAGPHMLDTMLRDRRLSRLYLTLTHRLLGGEQFHTMVPGPPLGQSGHLVLRTLYYDEGPPHRSGQWFAQFDCSTDASL
jgi:riboflavin biosynthesis pyrimidine reductase